MKNNVLFYRQKRNPHLWSFFKNEIGCAILFKYSKLEISNDPFVAKKIDGAKPCPLFSLFSSFKCSSFQYSLDSKHSIQILPMTGFELRTSYNFKILTHFIVKLRFAFCIFWKQMFYFHFCDFPTVTTSTNLQMIV